eukprot:m.438661 g.438661  ORF g.438661 m.438661 type:complete len:168 (+) comp21445_c0_seq25:581-1084(+)
MGRGIHGHPSLALYSTIDAIICEPYVTTSLPWSCGCLVHCEQLKRQLAESQKEKEAIQKKNKAQLSRMAQKVFARLQGNEEGLREQEEERRELKEWEVEAARKAKENEMEAERLREEANRAARKANERRLEGVMHGALVGLAVHMSMTILCQHVCQLVCKLISFHFN